MSLNPTPLKRKFDSKIARWDAHFIKIARAWSEMSRDKTKVGAVIAGYENEQLSAGYNGIPRYCSDTNSSRFVAPEKYFWFEHAERNAIYNAAKNGIRLDGSTLYSSAPLCADCARAVIQSGIRRVVMPKNHPFLGRKDWEKSLKVALEMMDEANVRLEWYED